MRRRAQNPASASKGGVLEEKVTGISRVKGPPARVPLRCTLPLAVYTFDYPWQEKTARSQNQLEEIFLADLETALPEGIQPAWIGDRGYARAALLRHCNQRQRLYILRGRAGTG